MKARFYDPQVGRFLQPDSIVPEPGNPQSLNRYSYVENNPLRYNDPTGHVGSCFLCSPDQPRRVYDPGPSQPQPQPVPTAPRVPQQRPPSVDLPGDVPIVVIGLAGGLTLTTPPGWVVAVVVVGGTTYVYCRSDSSTCADLARAIGGYIVEGTLEGIQTVGGLIREGASHVPVLGTLFSKSGKEGKLGDQRRANKMVGDAAKEAGLTPGQAELLHDEVQEASREARGEGRDLKYRDILDIAERIKQYGR